MCHQKKKKKEKKKKVVVLESSIIDKEHFAGACREFPKFIFLSLKCLCLCRVNVAIHPRRPYEKVTGTGLIYNLGKMKHFLKEWKPFMNKKKMKIWRILICIGVGIWKNVTENK